MTKQELRQYIRLDVELRRLEDKIATLEARILSPKIQQISDMPRGGPKNDLTDQVAKLVDLKYIYNVKWDELIDQQKKIEDAIGVLSDPVERALMGYRYIDGVSWEEVCVKIGYSWRQVHRLHGRALKKMA